MILTLLLLGADPRPVLAVSPAAIVDERVVGGAPTARNAALAWPAGARLTAVREGGELVVRADRPIAESAIARFQAVVGDAVDDLRWNDASLVLRAAPGWTLDWRRQGATLLVTLTPPIVVTAPGREDDGEGELARARVQADLAAGYPGRARRGAAALLARAPDDRQSARLLAEARAADGDLAGAAVEYRRLAADDRAARRAIAAGAGTATVAATLRDGRNFSQAEIGARAEVPLGGGVVANGGMRVVASRVALGTATRREAEPVIDAGVTAAIGDRTRVALVASAALDDRVTGGGVRVVHGPAEAQLRLGATYRLPDYSTIAQVIGRGTLSRAAAGGTLRLSSAVVAQADAGWNRYGLAGRRGGTDTLTLAGGVDLVLRRQFPTLGLGYRVEAEYVADDAAGAAPLFLATRENHTLQGLVGTSLGEVSLTGLAGWTVDRFGGDGPTASLGVAAPIGIGWRIEAGAGVSSASRPGFGGRQLFARAQVTRSLGTGQ